MQLFKKVFIFVSETELTALDVKEAPSNVNSLSDKTLILGNTSVFSFKISSFLSSVTFGKK